MILPYSTRWPDGTPTEFIKKIWAGIIHENLITATEAVEFMKSLKLSQRDLVANIDAADLVTFNPKMHTMREDAKDRWKPGTKIHMVVFNRSKNRFQFAPVLECKAVQKVEIIYTDSGSDYPCVRIDNRLYYLWVKPDFKVIETLAKNDGFNSVEHFFSYFNKDFTGKIIHWTNLTY